MRVQKWILALFVSMSLPCFAEDFTLQSTDFADQSILPVAYTCDGKNTQPLLMWSNTPAEAKSLAIIMTDQNLKPLWMVYNIPPNIKALDSTKPLPSGAKIALPYVGPCPKKGELQKYFIHIYALNTTLPLTPTQSLLSEIEKHKIIQAKITAIYSRWP